MIRPYHDNVVVELLPDPKRSKGGIAIPDNYNQAPTSIVRARVVASGPGYYRTKSVGADGRAAVGVFIPNQTKPGDIVLIDRLAGQDYGWDVTAPRRNGEVSWKDHSGEFRIIREEEIHAVVEGDVEMVA